MAGRGRPKKNAVLGGPAAPAKSPGIGDNSKISDDQLQKLTRDHALKRKHLIALEAKAKADRMNHDKMIKSDLGEFGLDNIKLLERLETPEGEAAAKAAMDREAMVFRWAGIPVGMQGTLFEEDRRPITERAHEDGKRAGMNGSDCAPPHAPGTDAAKAWIEGWQHSQSIKINEIKSTKPEAEIITPKGGKKKPAAQDDFDAAANGNDGVKTPTEGEEEKAEEEQGESGTSVETQTGDGKTWPDDQQVAAAKSPDL